MRLAKENLEQFESLLKERGYIKYIQHYNNEDYLYWKSFERTKLGEGGYSVGFAFYDFSKYPQCKDKNPIGVDLKFMLGGGQGIGRLDLSISDDKISVDVFEYFCKKFYEFYKENKL